MGRQNLWPRCGQPRNRRRHCLSAKSSREFQSAGIPTDAELAYGEPADQIIKWVEQKRCDLVAMSTHGHRFLADLFLGSTATRVRHNIGVPILLLRAK